MHWPHGLGVVKFHLACFRKIGWAKITFCDIFINNNYCYQRSQVIECYFLRMRMLFYKLCLQCFCVLHCVNCRIKVLQESNKKFNCRSQDALKSNSIPDSGMVTIIHLPNQGHLFTTQLVEPWFNTRFFFYKVSIEPRGHYDFLCAQSKTLLAFVISQLVTPLSNFSYELLAVNPLRWKDMFSFSSSAISLVFYTQSYSIYSR